MAAIMQEKLAVPGELEGLFVAHHDRVLKAAYRVTGSMADAEDVAQAVFLRIATAGNRERIDNPASYLYRAAINMSLDLLRKRRIENAVPIENAEGNGATKPGPEGEWDMRRWLRESLSQLDPRAAEMFVLRYIEEYDNRDIARMLNTSRAVVAVVLHRTRARLRNDYDAYMRGRK